MHGGYSRAYERLRFADVPPAPADAEDSARVGLINTYWSAAAPASNDDNAPSIYRSTSIYRGQRALRLKGLLRRAALVL